MSTICFALISAGLILTTLHVLHGLYLYVCMYVICSCLPIYGSLIHLDASIWMCKHRCCLIAAPVMEARAAVIEVTKCRLSLAQAVTPVKYTCTLRRCGDLLCNGMTLVLHKFCMLLALQLTVDFMLKVTGMVMQVTVKVRPSFVTTVEQNSYPVENSVITVV